MRQGDRFFPFCSATCRDRDLASWVNEGYRIEGPPLTPEEVATSEEGALGDDGRDLHDGTE